MKIDPGVWCQKFPLEKGGSAVGVGVVQQGRKAKERMMLPFEIRCAEVRISPIGKTTPRRPCRRPL